MSLRSFLHSDSPTWLPCYVKKCLRLYNPLKMKTVQIACAQELQVSFDEHEWLCCNVFQTWLVLWIRWHKDLTVEVRLQSRFLSSFFLQTPYRSTLCGKAPNVTAPWKTAPCCPIWCRRLSLPLQRSIVTNVYCWLRDLLTSVEVIRHFCTVA